MTFLKQYDLFKNLANAHLNSLTYGMVEQSCSRFQEIYKEGVDPVDNIYLVMSGEFQCSKRVPVDLK